MPRCVSFNTTAAHGSESWLGPHHQYDYEYNSTGADMARFYFRMAISVYPDMQFAMALIIVIASKQAGHAGFIFWGGHAEASCPCIKPLCPAKLSFQCPHHEQCCPLHLNMYTIGYWLGVLIMSSQLIVYIAARRPSGVCTWCVCKVSHPVHCAPLCTTPLVIPITSLPS